MQNHQFTAQKLGKSQHQAPAPAVPVPGKKRTARERIIPDFTPWHTRILNALQGRQVFAGIDPDENPGAANRLAKRRARNKVARASRRINRRR